MRKALVINAGGSKKVRNAETILFSVFLILKRKIKKTFYLLVFPVVFIEKLRKPLYLLVFLVFFIEKSRKQLYLLVFLVFLMFSNL